MIRQAGYAGFLLTLIAAVALQIVVLPPSVAPFRPMWLALIIVYWALNAPNLPILVAAWVLGLSSDVLFNTALGQHALGLVLLAFVIRRLQPVLTMFPLWQSTLAMIPAWAGYGFLMFWIDGLTRHPADPMLRWMPVLSTALAWPLLAALLGELRSRRGGGLTLP